MEANTLTTEPMIVSTRTSTSTKGSRKAEKEKNYRDVLTLVVEGKLREQDHTNMVASLSKKQLEFILRQSGKKVTGMIGTIEQISTQG